MPLGLLLAVAATAYAPPAESLRGSYLARPKSNRGAGVLVLHPWWGLNGDTKAFCRRLADQGFFAFAPDLFEGKTATTEAQAEALVKTYEAKATELKAKVRRAAQYLADTSGREHIAVVGFSFGSYYALELSNAEPQRVRWVVDFYGTGQEDFRRSQAAYLGHFAEKDRFEPKSNVESLKKLLTDAGRPVSFYTYPRTGHWFFEPSVRSAYNKAAADLAWERTVRFLKTASNVRID